MVGIDTHLWVYRGSRRNIWKNEGWMKARITCYLEECLTDGQEVEGLGQRKKRPKLGRKKGSSHSLMSSKAEGLRSVVPSTGGHGKRGHISARHKPRGFSALRGKQGGWP